MKSTIVAIIIFCMLSASALAASFDCSRAGTPVEETICANSQLSTLDEQLASTYKQAIANAIDKGQVKSEQRIWIKEVRNRCEDINCLTLSYKSRIDTLLGNIPIQTPSSTTQVDNDNPSAVSQSTLEKPQNVAQEVIAQEQSPTHSTDSEQPSLVSESPISEGTPAQSSSPIAQADNSTQPLVSQSTLEKPQNVAREVIAQKQSSTSPTNTEQSSSVSETLILKLIGVALLLNVLLAIYLHKVGMLVIFKDYTDAIFTGLAPLLSIVFYFLLLFFEVSPVTARIIAGSLFAILMVFIVISTAQNNNGLSIFFVVSLIAKITIIAFYYAIMAFILLGRGSERRKGESQAAYEARLWREKQDQKPLMVVITAIFLALSAWVCKYPKFTSIGEYFSSTPKKTLQDFKKPSTS